MSQNSAFPRRIAAARLMMSPTGCGTATVDRGARSPPPPLLPLPEEPCEAKAPSKAGWGSGAVWQPAPTSAIAAIDMVVRSTNGLLLDWGLRCDISDSFQRGRAESDICPGVRNHLTGGSTSDDRLHREGNVHLGKNFSQYICSY